MEKRLQNLWFLGCMLALTSCVDKSYDLKNVDYTLANDVDLTLPASSTGNILLRNIMDLKDEGVVQLIDDGQGRQFYCVRQSGEAHIDPINIREIRIPKPNIDDIHKQLNLLTDVQQSVRRRISVVVDGKTVTIDPAVYRYQLKAENVKFDFQSTSVDDIDPDVTSIEHVGIRPDTIILRGNVVDYPKFVEQGYMEDLYMNIPDEVEVQSCTFNGTPATVLADGRIQLTTATTSIQVRDGITIKLVIRGISTGDNFQFDSKAHTADLTGSISFQGNLKLLSEDFNVQKLNQEIASGTLGPQIAQNRSLDALMPSHVLFEGSAWFSDDIYVQRVTGRVHHEIGDVDPIKLTDIPDFLNDDEAVIDLDNPMVLLQAYSQIPAEVSTAMTLSSHYADGQSVSRSTGQLVIHGNDATDRYYLASKSTTALPAAYAGATFCQVNDLGGLIRRIPNQVQVEMQPVDIQFVDVDITRPYEIRANYDIYAPITFGPNFHLVYRDTERGWIEEGDLDKLDKLDGPQIEATAEADNSLPADISFTLIPIDEQGQRISQLEVSSVTIPASVQGHSISLTIKPAQGYTLNDVLAGKNGVHQLDGITYEARVLNPQQGATLYSDAQIKLNKICIRVCGTVTYDAN